MERALQISGNRVTVISMTRLYLIDQVEVFIDADINKSIESFATLNSTADNDQSVLKTVFDWVNLLSLLSSFIS